MTYLNSRDLLQLQHNKCSFSYRKECKTMKRRNIVWCLRQKFMQSPRYNIKLDFNVKVGRNCEWEPKRWKENLHGETNENGLQSQETLRHTVSPYEHPQRDMKITRWTDNQSDYILMDGIYMLSLVVFKVFRRANITSAHFLLPSKAQLRVVNSKKDRTVNKPLWWWKTEGGTDNKELC